MSIKVETHYFTQEEKNKIQEEVARLEKNHSIYAIRQYIANEFKCSTTTVRRGGEDILTCISLNSFF